MSDLERQEIAEQFTRFGGGSQRALPPTKTPPKFYMRQGKGTHFLIEWGLEGIDLKIHLYPQGMIPAKSEEKATWFEGVVEHPEQELSPTFHALVQSTYAVLKDSGMKVAWTAVPMKGSVYVRLKGVAADPVLVEPTVRSFSEQLEQVLNDRLARPPAG